MENKNERNQKLLRRRFRSGDEENTGGCDEEYWLDGPQGKKPRSFASGIGVGVLMTAIVFAVLVAALLGFSRYRKENPDAAQASGEDAENAVSEILTEDVEEKVDVLSKYLQLYYYEDLDPDALAEGLYAGLFEAAGDVYTEYYTAEEYATLNQQTTGTYYGIGAIFTQDPETMKVTVSRVYEGTPAEEAGLKNGDVVISVDEYEADSMELSELVTHIKGEEGTSVHIKVAREGEDGDVEMDVYRTEVHIPTVAGEMVDDKIGYLEISEFSDVTTDQFEETLEELQGRGMEAVIFDLRGNPGGTITSVTEILDDILPEGVVVYTENKDGEREEYTSDAEHCLDMPMAVLIDGDSASASEIFAGAVQDFGWGTVIGTTSFGKGIVQTIIPLNDGSAMKITTAKYFTPDGNYIHEVGITPDIEVEYEYTGSTEEYEFTGDNQVMKAVEVLSE